jgi:hypothetical protein
MYIVAGGGGGGGKSSALKGLMAWSSTKRDEVMSGLGEHVCMYAYMVVMRWS